MRQKTYQVSTPTEQIATFCQFAEKFKSDYLTDELEPIRSWSLRELWRQIQARYLREQGEQIIRPLYYWRDGVGGDCDDATIQFMAYFRAAGVPPENIIICEAREPQNDYYSHIFAALQNDDGSIIWLDNLPESRFNVLDYPGELVRLTRMVDYL